MPTIEVKVSNFNGRSNLFDETIQLKVSRLKFMKYAMTAGMPLFGGSEISSLNALELSFYKAIGVNCALDFSGSQINSKFPPNIDPTEKGNLSTWVGMTGAALVADKILGVSQLHHTDALRKSGKLQVIDPNSRKLADFVGLDTDNKWHVIEAKARQRTPSKKERDKWKAQAKTVGKIGGDFPATYSYCYTEINDPCRIELCDPTPNEERVDLELTEGKFGLVDAYYHVLKDVLQHAKEIPLKREKREIRLALVGFDPTVKEYIHVGLDSRVYKWVLKREIPSRVKPVENDGIYMASDGVVITTSRFPIIEHENDLHRRPNF